MQNTEAWVLTEGAKELRREAFAFADVEEHEVLVEPLYVSWEANLTHAIRRQPVDINRERGEHRLVLGNAGVVRVLRVGGAPSTRHLRPGQLCMFFGGSRFDRFGYMVRAHAYDAAGTVGLLAKETKVIPENLVPLPEDTRVSLPQWAAFSCRYVTAWANWRVALGALRLQLSEQELPEPIVWGWGGGTTLAQLDLARRHGCAATMVVGNPARRREAAQTGVTTVDRRAFPDLEFDEARFVRDEAYRAAYKESERRFLALVHDTTRGEGVNVFVDYIGTPMLKVTLKAMARQGVLTTAGWKCGMQSRVIRASECIQRHIHVHTHYARTSEAAAAMQYAEAHGWVPSVTVVYPWQEASALARDYDAGSIDSYFPVLAVSQP